MLAAYFDESESHEHVFAVAGFVAEDQHWNAFNKRWRRTLRKWKLNKFRMADFEHRSSPYSHISRADGVTLLQELHRHINQMDHFSVSTAVIRPACDALPVDDRQLLGGDAYVFCALDCMGQVLKDAKARGKTQKIAFTFEAGPKGKGAIRAAYEWTRPHVDMQLRRMLGQLVFEPDDLPALDAADMIA